MQKDT